jgi:ParB family chromosome partitioning protein
MAQAKIALIPPQTIPLDKLMISDANVRQIKGGISIESLADSIARCGLLQSLSVRPILDDDGIETGTYGIQAGGRRYRALKLLVKQKKLAKNAPIPCIVKMDGLAEVDSLAENTEREALHPLDQFRAFSALRDKGQGVEQIAAAFGVYAAVVKQRLKLTAVSSELLKLYEEDDLTLDQLMAFTVSDDQDRQLKAYRAIAKGWDKSPRAIRKLLTEDTVRAGDCRAVFVGADAYKAAGGIIIRDLFEKDGGGWLQDADLLNRLVDEKLRAEADKVRAEGWKWVESAIDFPFGHQRGLLPLIPIAPALTDAEEEEYDLLCSERGEMEEQTDVEDELSEELQSRLIYLNQRIADYANRSPQFEPADMARAGAFVSIMHDGSLHVERGYVRPEDQTRANDQAAEPGSGDAMADANARDTAISPREAGSSENYEDSVAIPERLKTELTAHRTLALRDAVVQDHEVAYLAVLHAMALGIFYRYSSDTCLQIAARDTLTAPFPGLGDTPWAKAVEARHQEWQAKLPERPEHLWAWLTGTDEHSRKALFAHCAALSVNAVIEPHQRAEGRINHADHLAQATSLDLTKAGWITTTENYLKQVTKSAILTAVREAKGEATAELLADLKKAEMAVEAERLIRDTGWLPELLRTPVSDQRPDDQITAAALPAFLEEDHLEEAA